VLYALCRPLAIRPETRPGTNQQTAGQLNVGVDALRWQLKDFVHVIRLDLLPGLQKTGVLAEGVDHGLGRRHQR
jgi:hypothetical protein